MHVGHDILVCYLLSHHAVYFAGASAESGGHARSSANLGACLLSIKDPHAFSISDEDDKQLPVFFNLKSIQVLLISIIIKRSNLVLCLVIPVIRVHEAARLVDTLDSTIRQMLSS